MTPAMAPLLDGVGLLERAINYTLGSLHVALDRDLSAPTPCRRWDLRTLLAHLDDSLLALHEAAETGHVDLDGDSAPAADPVATVRTRARELLGAWTSMPPPDGVSVDDLALTTAIVTTTGAVEVCVHGWDVAMACGHRRPVPAGLAEDLLELAPLLVTGADRPARFAAPVVVPAHAAPGERLLAFLGRES